MGKVFKPSKRTAAKTAGVAAVAFVVVGGTAITLDWTFWRRVATYPKNPITDVDW